MSQTSNHTKHLAQCMEQSINACQMTKQTIICQEKCVEHAGTVQSTESITRNKTSEILLSGSSQPDGEGSPRTQQTTAVNMVCSLIWWNDCGAKKSHAQSLVKSLGIQDEIALPPFKARMTNSNVNRGQVGNINDQQRGAWSVLTWRVNILSPAWELLSSSQP